MTCLCFFEGAVIGFSLAEPIGPVGILFVRRTLEHGARYGLVIGVSAAMVSGGCKVFHRLNYSSHKPSER
jgi:threonine/homoserine/homoserine lactone efflux protein